MGKNHNRNDVFNGQARIPKEVKEFGSRSFKKFYKKNKEDYAKKKDAREDFYWEQVDYLPTVIDYLCRNIYSQNPDIQEAKIACYDQFLSADDKDRFVKYLKEHVKESGMDLCENIQYLPILLREMIQSILKYIENRQPNDPEMDPPTELFELSKAILKKKLKKFDKADIDKALGFELLSIMPAPDAIKYSRYSRVKEVFEVIYKYAENLTFDVNKIFDILFNKSDYDIVIGYALQERKEKVKSFNSKQEAIWSAITKWAFVNLEDMSESEIRTVLTNYIKLRKRDAMAGKDSNRRFYISSLPEDYETINKVVNAIKNSDSEAEKYL